MAKKTAFLTGLLLLLLVAAESAAELYPKTGVIRIRVTGLESDKGSIRADLYDKKDRWMKPERAVVSKVVKAKAGTIEFEMVAPIGRRYALSIHHDENGNGKVDTGFIPKPIEPVGASNFSGDSIPRFYDCSFRFDTDPLELSVGVFRP
jgi:uncharacterized protein (DUF2141 family)